MKFQVDKNSLHLILGDSRYTFANTRKGVRKMFKRYWQYKGVTG